MNEQLLTFTHHTLDIIPKESIQDPFSDRRASALPTHLTFAVDLVIHFQCLASMASLADLGRKRFISQSALSELLKELATLDELPSAKSRQSIKRAREERVSIEGPMGPLLVQRTFRTIEGWIMWSVTYLFHMCLLWNFDTRHARAPCDIAR